MKRASGFYWIGFCLTGPDQRLSFQARIDPNNTTIAYWSKILREWQIAGDWEALKDGPHITVVSEKLVPPVRKRTAG